MLTKQLGKSLNKSVKFLKGNSRTILVLVLLAILVGLVVKNVRKEGFALLFL